MEHVHYSHELLPESDLMTVREVAEYLRVPLSWVYGRTRAQGIPLVRIGKHIRVSRQELIAWVADGAE
jgi:excisionase family DNA binding protein